MDDLHAILTKQSSTLPATLRAIRAKLYLTQEKLAEQLKVSFATVNRWVKLLGNAVYPPVMEHIVRTLTMTGHFFGRRLQAS